MIRLPDRAMMDAEGDRTMKCHACGGTYLARTTKTRRTCPLCGGDPTDDEDQEEPEEEEPARAARARRPSSRRVEVHHHYHGGGDCSPGLALVLSVFYPGLGHLYAGDFFLGLVIGIGCPIFYIVALVAGGFLAEKENPVALFLLALPFVHIGQFIAAYRAAEAKNRRARR